MMMLGPDGLAVLQYFEQCHLKAYPDPASPLARALAAHKPAAGLSGAPWTIGWGNTGPDVVPGTVWTQAEADSRLAMRLAREFEPIARLAIRVTPTQRQFDAFVSILYNTGPGGNGRDGVVRLASGKPSTLLRLFNEGNFEGAAEQFLSWNRAGGQILLGLRRRREAERALFLGATGAQAIAIGAAIK